MLKTSADEKTVPWNLGVKLWSDNQVKCTRINETASKYGLPGFSGMRKTKKGLLHVFECNFCGDYIMNQSWMPVSDYFCSH